MPSGKCTIDPKTHHAVRDVYIADLQDKKFIIKEKFSQVQPADTLMVCDLEKNPNSNKHYEISLNYREIIIFARVIDNMTRANLYDTR